MRRGRLIKALFVLFPRLQLVEEARELSSKMKLPVKVAIGCALLLVFMVVFGWIMFPKILRNKIKDQIALKPGSEMRGMYTKVPFYLDFKIYVFNVTNAMEVQKGGSPVLDEIGPYFYQEWKEKLNVIDSESDDSMYYNPRDTFIFDQEKSGKLTGDEIVTIPHPLIAGLITAVSREKPSMVGLVGKALNTIHKNPETIFLTAPVKDILFDGVLVSCAVTDFAAKAVCGQLKTKAKELQWINDDEFKFSLFGAKNASLGGRFKVKRGIKNSHDVGRVVEYENQTIMDVWPTKKCNQYQGTDGTIFPPYLAPEEGLVSFAPDLCRSLAAEYQSDTYYKGIPVRKYVATLGDMSKDKELKCYCLTPETCLKRGGMDLGKCNGNPIVATLPHFYDCDESYKRNIRGLHPREEEHGIYILFESITGSPVSARKRLQFNLPLQPFDKVPLMQEVPEVILPIFWIEEGIDLNATYTKQLGDLFKITKIMGILRWVVVVGCLVGIGISGYLYFKSTNEVKITPVHKVQPTEDNKQSVISMIQQNSLGNGNGENGWKNRAFMNQAFQKD